MPFQCPVCNGLMTIDVGCPKCGERMADGGRIDDYLGPYSPYRPIDDLKMTNGYPDLLTHTCVHSLHCDGCGYTEPHPVKEWGTRSFP